jgi:hypothetical protein
MAVRSNRPSDVNASNDVVLFDQTLPQTLFIVPSPDNSRNARKARRHIGRNASMQPKQRGNVG